MNTKAVLKFLKLNESAITTALGLLLIFVAGIIVVNFFRGSTKPDIQTGTSTVAEEAGQPTIERGEGPVTYTVKPGESLWSIAEKQYGSGYNWVDIAQTNKLSNPNALNAGQTVTIPDVEPKITTVKGREMDESSVTPTDSISSTTYEIKAGDTLWDISTRAYDNGFAWTKLAEANKLRNPHLIYPGSNIAIPR